MCVSKIVGLFHYSQTHGVENTGKTSLQRVFWRCRVGKQSVGLPNLLITVVPRYNLRTRYVAGVLLLSARLEYVLDDGLYGDQSCFLTCKGIVYTSSIKRSTGFKHESDSSTGLKLTLRPHARSDC